MKLHIKNRNTEVKYHIIKSKLIERKTYTINKRPSAASIAGGAAE